MKSYFISFFNRDPVVTLMLALMKRLIILELLLEGKLLPTVCVRKLCDHLNATHFPSGFNQFRKIVHRSVIPFYKPETSPKKTTLVVYSDKSVFWTFLTSKLTNLQTRFWTCDTCHVGSESTM